MPHQPTPLPPTHNLPHRTLYLGVDPGSSGAMALVDARGEPVTWHKLSSTERDCWDWLEGYAEDIEFGVLEQVSAMPKQGVSSTFKFGTSFGFCRGLLVCAGVRFEMFTPVTWQNSLRCRTKGDKRVSKSKAQELFPSVRVTHAIADALLIAEFARRTAATRQTGANHER